MAEVAWFRSGDPQIIVAYIRNKASDRKLRLFSCAYCRTIWDLLRDHCFRDVVEAAEKYADGLISKKELANVRNPTKAALDRLQRSGPIGPTEIASASAWSSGRIPASIGAMYVTGFFAEPDHVQVQLRLLRDIFIGPNQTLPPRPQAIAPLAERIYAGEWNLMPILGEWLQEHGYWSEGEHCLDPNNHHIKGCWVVDWVTGRE